MEFWNLHLISWKSFLLILIGLFALMFVYKTILKGILGNYLSEAHGKQLDPRFIYIQRILIMTWVFLLILSFIMVSPFIHGALLVVGVLLTYQYLSNYIQGTFLIKELSLIRGMRFSIGDNSGLIDKLSATGLFLSFSDKSYFIAYNQLMHQMGASHHNVRSSKLKLICSPTEPEDFDKSKDKLNRKLFLNPFINDRIKPNIKQAGSQIEISLQLKNPEYAQNIIQTVEKAGFIIDPEEN